MKRSDVLEWVEKAEGDYETVLDLVKKRRKRQLYIIAFHSQQCIEKYLKALLTLHKINFPKQHDLEALLTLLMEKDAFLAPLGKELKTLTPFAVGIRYPGDEVTGKEVREAVKVMKRIRPILRKRLGFKK